MSKSASRAYGETPRAVAGLEGGKTGVAATRVVLAAIVGIIVCMATFSRTV
jgi:hypothetical protein